MRNVLKLKHLHQNDQFLQLVARAAQSIVAKATLSHKELRSRELISAVGVTTCQKGICLNLEREKMELNTVRNCLV